MLIVALLTFIALCSASPMIRDPFDVPSTSDLKQTSVRPADPFFSFNGDENTGRIFHMDVDGIAAVQPKKTEKMPMQKRLKQRLFDEDRPIPDVLPGPRDLEFLQPQPGVAPKLTGSVGSGDAEESTTPINFEFFNFGEGDGPVVNPAATYLDGGNFEKVSPPKCVMQGCTGPLPNDGTFSVDPPATAGKACHQTFVPLNGCTDNKGYPMGMLCSICCDCTASFVKEMKKTHGYKIGYPA
ncbi:hypothetical protein ANCCAN_17108 [Ancylostoma caninum]|uniref:Uncharacterized protein n=1 Tax=Ancylostoma caninum TaxID=29170 RepID=A0A368FXU5_ANCCA|nr:hypothetical protein ANCCAN_17108 [Ancylostoma caninum]